jgi:hypothetical protein
MMKKVTNTILIGLACTAVLSLSMGVQPVKASYQPPVRQTKDTGEQMGEFNIIQGDHVGFYSLQANHLVNGFISDKTTKMSVVFNYGGYFFDIVAESTGETVYSFTSANNGAPVIININKPFKAGETYRVAPGGKSGNYFKFIVVSAELKVPTIDKVTSQDKNITGTGIPGSTLHLNIAGDDYTGTVDAQGKYTIALNKAYPVNSSITVYQEKDGVRSETIKSSVAAPDQLNKPTLDKVTVNDQKVTGTGLPGATVVLDINGESYYGVVDENGRFSILTNKYYPLGTRITAYQEMDGIKSPEVQTTVVAPDQLDIPHLNKVTDQDTRVTGTALPGATVRLTINGTHFHSQASSNGEFSINIEKKYPANTPIEAYQELNGMKSETTTVYVQLTSKLIVEKIKTNSPSIIGSAHPNAKITIQIDDEDFEGTADSNGHFIIDLQGATFRAGTDVIITAESPEGTQKVTVQIYPKDPIVGIIYAGDKDIRGTADPGSTVIISVGATKYQTTTDNNGDFRQSVDPTLLVSGVNVSVHSTINGLESDKVVETVI